MLFPNAIPCAFAYRDDRLRECVPGGIVDPRTKQRKVVSDDLGQASVDLRSCQGPMKLLIPDVTNNRISEVPYSALFEFPPQISADLQNVLGKDIAIAIIDFGPFRESHDEVRQTEASKGNFQ